MYLGFSIILGLLALMAVAIVIRDAVAYREFPQLWGIVCVLLFVSSFAVFAFASSTQLWAVGPLMLVAMLCTRRMKRRSLYGPGAEEFLARLRARVRP